MNSHTHIGDDSLAGRPSAEVTLSELPTRILPPLPWADGDNIPWDEPGFSKRMFDEHLSQAHDLASRRTDLIDAHVGFIEQQLGQETGAQILDLGCGPGLYLHRLARLGHRCHGIDFSPASIAHAQRVAEDEALDCTFEEADLRSANFGEGFDQVLLVYGQLNVFERDDARDILQRAHAALVPGGTLLLEPQHPDVISGPVEGTTDWSAAQSGLFSAAPHLLLHERFWDEETRTATDRWYVIDAVSAAVQHHAMSTCSYTADELSTLLEDVGFESVQIQASLTGDDETATPGLFAVVASR